VRFTDRACGHGLGQAVAAVIGGADGQPWEELLEGTHPIGFGFTEPLARDLHVEVLCAGQAQRRRQIDRIGWTVRLSPSDTHTECERAGGVQRASIAERESHFTSVAATACPSLSI
jgi:hypothetical protein